MARILLILTCTAWFFSVTGCATKADKTETVKEVPSIAETRTLTAEAPFDAVWESTRDAFNTLELNIYTRDRRGFFVTFSDVKRRAILRRRMQYTVILTDQGDTTRVELETIPQKYAVSLLTYPGWHEDSKIRLRDDSEAILDEIQRLIDNQETAD